MHAAAAHGGPVWAQLNTRSDLCSPLAAAARSIAHSVLYSVMTKLMRVHTHLHSPSTSGIPTQLYMVMLVIFCTNSINILAGVNGLEAGQTFVIACAVLGHNLLSVAGYAAANPAVRDGHLFSAYLMFPLAGVTLGLLVFNW